MPSRLSLTFSNDLVPTSSIVVEAPAVHARADSPSSGGTSYESHSHLPAVLWAASAHAGPASSWGGTSSHPVGERHCAGTSVQFTAGAPASRHRQRDRLGRGRGLLGDPQAHDPSWTCLTTHADVPAASTPCIRAPRTRRPGGPRFATRSPSPRRLACASSLSVFDVSGRLVRSWWTSHGRPVAHVAAWSGTHQVGRAGARRRLSRRMQAGSFAATRRLVVIR